MSSNGSKNGVHLIKDDIELILNYKL